MSGGRRPRRPSSRAYITAVLCAWTHVLLSLQQEFGVRWPAYGHDLALDGVAARWPAGSPETAVSIVRPTYVAGPLDQTRRFTWWVEQIAVGGRVPPPARQAIPSRSSTPGT